MSERGEKANEKLEMIKASDLVKNPTMNIEGRYRTLYDHSFGFSAKVWPVFENFETAMNIMADRGWVLKLMSAVGIDRRTIYVIMEKIQDDQ